ncbi:MAG TPA: hypothetical protein VFU02_21320 [Polyangiaceae bacterium]|nr:hypothetical protein [Polyangiaceae bacterium]
MDREADAYVLFCQRATWLATGRLVAAYDFAYHDKVGSQLSAPEAYATRRRFLAYRDGSNLAWR